MLKEGLQVCSDSCSSLRLELTVFAVTDPALEGVHHGRHVAPVVRVATQSHGHGGEGQTIVAELELFVTELPHEVSFSSSD